MTRWTMFYPCDGGGIHFEFSRAEHAHCPPLAWHGESEKRFQQKVQTKSFGEVGCRSYERGIPIWMSHGGRLHPLSQAAMPGDLHAAVGERERQPFIGT